MVMPTLSKQLQLFIVEPMRKITWAHATIITIDGLDECGDERICIDPLRAIAEASYKLLSTPKIFLTSQNEPDIHAKLILRK